MQFARNNRKIEPAIFSLKICENGSAMTLNHQLVEISCIEWLGITNNSVNFRLKLTFEDIADERNNFLQKFCQKKSC